MSKRIDMVGQKFGKLIVKALSKNRSGKRKRLMWICDCDCGNTNIEVIGEHLRSGHTTSCGCYQQERRSTSRYKYTGEKFLFDLDDYDN